MKLTFWHRAIFWAILLSFGFVLTGKAVACVSPSMMEMSQGKAMDCCMERCRMDATTREAAEKSCAQSRHALSAKETLSSPQAGCEHALATMLSDASHLPLFFTPVLESNDRINQFQSDGLIKRHASSVPIYTAIQIFLI